MSKKRKREPLPDLRRQGVIVGMEADGSLFDIGRFGELEALGMSSARKANAARDELIRRATIVLCRLDRDTTLADLKALGRAGLRRKGVEYVLEPSHDVFVIFRWGEQGRGEPLFWVFLALLALTPGGGSPIFRGPEDNPVAAVQIRIGGDPQLIGAIRDVNWHAPGNTIWTTGEDDDDPGRGDSGPGAGGA